MKDINPAGVAASFDFPGALSACTEIKTGHINRTYRLTYRQADGTEHAFLLQRINTFAFHKPDEVMENVLLVTDHLRRALIAQGVDPERRVLRVIPARNGAPLAFDDEGGAWRAYGFIENAHSVNAVESPAQFMEVGRAFGDFQNALADFPIERLHDTIPFFHDTIRRMENFEASVARDVAHRVVHAQPEIAFARARRDSMGEIVRMIESGVLPLRVTHNDTKCNNVMVDDATGEALCVVDLDTVMAGSSLYDFGDAIRFGASTAAEDETDLSKVRLDMQLFDAFADGFISKTANGLTETELINLPLGALVMTFEVGLRFLTDYLDGDVYFHIARAEHNLERARTQFRLLADMEAHRGDMESSVMQLIARYRSAPSSRTDPALILPNHGN